MKIPKIIHQIWIGTKEAPKFLGSWGELHKDYEYIIWDDRKVKKMQLVNKHLYEAYDHEEQNIWNGRANLLRIELLNKYGGIYIDADIECLRPMTGSFLDSQFFCVYANEQRRGKLINNAVIGSTSQHPIISSMINKLRNKKKVEQPSHVFSGPRLFTECVKEYKRNICILPSYYFYPEFYDGTKYTGDFQPFGRHYWGETKKLYGKI